MRARFFAPLFFGLGVVLPFAALASNLDDQEVATVKHCFYGASNHNLSDAQLLNYCEEAAKAYSKHLTGDTDAEERQEFSKSQALCEIYAASAAMTLHKVDIARTYATAARSTLNDLETNGYNKDIRSQSRRAIECFFEKDHDACTSLFPGG
jgi:hypothetical protein